ncbi:MAG: hypothetical protein RRA92_02015 [Gemmatimonadota bacterium]|nr:hypothetical protein [Gemmatimonadota bacterium]
MRPRRGSCGPAGRWRAGLRRAVVAAACPLALAACTEDPLTGIDPDTAPGATTPTRQLEIPIAALPAWRDTTYAGFVTPATSGFRILADSADLQARILGRFETLPDSATAEEEQRVVERFDAARFRVRLDTLDSVVPEGGVALEVYSLARPFDAAEATWQQAASGEPWSQPGGDLGELLGSATFEAVDTTFFVPVAVDVDSLLAAWRGEAGEPGFLLRLSGEGAWLDVSAVALTFDMVLAGVDTLVSGARSPSTETLLFEPAAAPPGTTSRLGALPAARVYITLDLPETWDGVDLRGATINAADLVLRPQAAEPPPFTLTSTLGVRAVDLLGDPFELGPKTPIGARLGFRDGALNPDSLDAGGELAVPIPLLVANWAAADPDSSLALRIGLIPSPEGAGLGFRTFGSAESPPELQPFLRLLVTPRVAFGLPL